MTPSGLPLQQFAKAAIAAFNQFAQTPESRRSIRRISSALDTPGAQWSGPGIRLPVYFYLDTALAVETKHASLLHLTARFKVIEPLSGDRRGQHCIRINKQFRVRFRWTKAGAKNVEIVDYH